MFLLDESAFEDKPTATFSMFEEDDATTEAEPIELESDWDFSPSPALEMVRRATAIWELGPGGCDLGHKRPH